jgi:hypothetical protein
VPASQALLLGRQRKIASRLGDSAMAGRYRAIADRYREHDVSKKQARVFGSCVNLFVVNLCLALGIWFDYVDLTVSLPPSADRTPRCESHGAGITVQARQSA